MKKIIKKLPKKMTDREKLQMFNDKLSNHECYVLFNQLGQSYGRELAENLRDSKFKFIDGLGYSGDINFNIFKYLKEVKQEEDKINLARKELEFEIKKQFYKEIK